MLTPQRYNFCLSKLIKSKSRKVDTKILVQRKTDKLL